MTVREIRGLVKQWKIVSVGQAKMSKRSITANFRCLDKYMRTTRNNICIFFRRLILLSMLRCLWSCIIIKCLAHYSWQSQLHIHTRYQLRLKSLIVESMSDKICSKCSFVANWRYRSCTRDLRHCVKVDQKIFSHVLASRKTIIP